MGARRKANGVFLNDGDFFQHGLSGVLKWVSNRNPTPWPKHLPAPHFDHPPKAITSGMRVSFVNHATVLIQIAGINFITDPVFSNRVSPLSWIGPRRSQAPGIRLQDLPPLDFVLLSHNHYDHLDRPALKEILKAHKPCLVTGLENKHSLRGLNFGRICELDWWQSESMGTVKITYVPARHFSGRALWDRNKELWGGHVIEVAGQKIFFAGDTGYGEHFKQIKEKFGPMDLSLLPIGAYDPRWFMSPVHMDPVEAVQAHLDLSSKKSLGIHFGTFRLTDEPIDEPGRLLTAELARRGISAQDFEVPANGQVLSLK